MLLFEKRIRWALSIARREAKRFRRLTWIGEEDVDNVGLLALWLACSRHVPGTGKLGGFARTYVEGRVRKLFERQHGLRFDSWPSWLNGTPVDLEDKRAKDPGEVSRGKVQWGELLSALSGRQRQVITGIYQRGLTGTEVAADLGVTRQLVSLVHAKALARLRHLAREGKGAAGGEEEESRDR